eukprot:1007451_1
MSTGTTVFFVTLCTLLSCFSCSWFKSAKPALTEERRALLKQHMDPAYSPEYQQWMQSITVNSIGEEVPDRRQLQGCPDQPPYPPWCQASPSSAPTPPPVKPPIPGGPDFDPLNPFVKVDFGEYHISWNTSNEYCKHELTGDSTLGFVNKYDTRRTEAEQIDAMKALCAQTQTGHCCWIGLKWSNDTLDWRWINNEPLTTIDWAPGEPMIDVMGPNMREVCAVLNADQDYKWSTVSCQFGAPDYVTHAALCSNPYYVAHPTPPPTGAPTPSPTDKPTPHPTNRPTPRPTPHPTNRPTPQPTPRPTNKPTRSPSPSPTDRPTPSPTPLPTDKPTPHPTDRPTPRPTPQPPDKPTPLPTTAPTPLPTPGPSPLPTPGPTPPPSPSPSRSPSDEPTPGPTDNPSPVPSLSPSPGPTSPPSPSPTRSPTDEPSSSPTKNPTPSPTRVPTGEPTKDPSPSPTRLPSKDPSPSPSKNPSPAPSQGPSQPPSPGPTNVPTTTPTMRPTHHGQMPVGVPQTGPYSDAPVEFIVQMPFDGRFIFDASATSFYQDITSISAVDSLGVSLPGAIDNPILDVPNTVIEDYTVTLTAKPGTTGTYQVLFRPESANPTPAPTRDPSPGPTKNPTPDPTNVPSTTPSSEPTTSPSDEPTSSPTRVPSSAPSDEPSSSPTDKPSRLPTDNPTTVPTPGPSPFPSKVPTAEPSLSPSRSPSDDPTPSPTLGPSDIPSEEPTLGPTPLPSSKPTNPPSDEPTAGPSRGPTRGPTPRPSEDPSTSPTERPTDNPSSSPTDRPTDNPSPSPTERPTDNPIPAPTGLPTGSPSKEPTRSPFTPRPKSPSDKPTQVPSADPTPSPTGHDEPCDDDRKEWDIAFSCPGTPQFELVTSCAGGYAVQVRLDKIFEVDVDKRGCGNEIGAWGKRNKWKADLDFMWDGGNGGETVRFDTVDGEQRQVLMNRFSARISKKLKGKGGRKMETDAWLNITVLFFTDPRGGVFDLRGTGNPSDYTIVQRNTLKYFIEASNWPFRRKSDLLAIRFAYELKEISDPTLTQCAYDGRSKGKKGSKGDTEGWECNEDKRSDTNPDGWGPYDEPCLTFTSGDAADTCRNYAFGIDFRLESNMDVIVDGARDEMQEPLLEGVEWDGMGMTHYIPRFETLEWDGPSLFYYPTFNFWATHDTSRVIQGGGSSGDAGKSLGYDGEDLDQGPGLKTIPEKDNGFLSEFLSGISWQNWIYVGCGMAVVAVLLCLCCCGVCKKIRQNTHEDKTNFVQLE